VRGLNGKIPQKSLRDGFRMKLLALYYLEQGGMPERQLHHLLDLGQLLSAATNVIIPAQHTVKILLRFSDHGK
jgi:hypothetical protein